jgi:predicted Zn finger-like uncharacterized protein
MALATRCPHCHTTFRVAHDQLKLRAGLVRCGTCKEIFNGVEHLLPTDKLPQSAAQASAAISPANAVAEQPSGKAAASSVPTAPSLSKKRNIAPAESGGVVKSTSRRKKPPANRPIDAPTPAVASGGDNDNDPLQRMTLVDFAAFDEPESGPAGQENSAGPVVPDDPRRLSHAEGSADTSDELDRAIEDLQRKPWRSTKKPALRKDEDDPEDMQSGEPDFVMRARRQQRTGRALRILMSFVSFVLLIGLLAQATYIFRSQIAAWLPETAPVLVNACGIIGCRVDLPAQIDAVSIESNELQALPSNQNTFVLTTLLRNRSAIVQAWPNIELTLNDANEKAIVRRVFTPRDYLPSAQDVTKGFAANWEQPIKLFFEVSQLKASGYRVYLFYP